MATYSHKLHSLIIVVVCTFLLLHCDQSARSWLRSFADYPPDWVVLRETRTDGKVEHWIGYRPVTHAARIVRSQCESADHKDTLESKVEALPERIFYIFESPNPLKQHSWNIDVDEPNYVYRWHNGELTLLKEHKDTRRDKQNRFLDDTPVVIPRTL